MESSNTMPMSFPEKTVDDVHQWFVQSNNDDDGDGDGNGDGDVCSAQDATPEGDCELLLGVVWNGESCDFMSGCSCVGTDCDNLFETLDACEDVYSFCNQECTAQNAMGVGPCDAEVGIIWDGAACVSISGCECAGPDCGNVFETMQDCEYQYQLCGEP